jgi:hypothetical protein
MNAGAGEPIGGHLGRMVASAAAMLDADNRDRTDLYHGLFRWHTGGDGRACVSRHSSSPASIPCPTTGRSLHVATLEADAHAICPSCERHGRGGFVSFVGDLRMAYACPLCLQLIWLSGV